MEFKGLTNLGNFIKKMTPVQIAAAGFIGLNAVTTVPYLLHLQAQNNPQGYAESVRNMPQATQPSAPDPRSHTATEVAGGFTLDRKPAAAGWTTSRQTCTVTLPSSITEERCEFRQGSDGSWEIRTQSGNEFYFHQYSEEFLVNGDNVCRGNYVGVFYLPIKGLGVHSVACGTPNGSAYGIAWDDNSLSL